MPSQSKIKQIHYEALLEFDNIQASLRDERLQCLKDRRFYSIAGSQWEGPLAEQFENKPKFEVNKIHLSIIRIINEYRNNRITVNFVSKDGIDDDSLADLCDGLYRADEDNSVADEAYDNAFEEGSSGGIGAWRLRTGYEDDEDPDNDHQRIFFEPIYDADSSVFFDLQAKRQDKKDAKKCFVISSMTREAYKDEWGDDPTSWSKEIHQHEFDWSTPDIVYIAEYYLIEETQETIHVWKTLDGQEKRFNENDLDNELERLEAIGAKETRVKKIKRKKVHKYIMSGGKVLEDCGYIAGTCIPIVPMYGKRWFVDNIERCMGHVRLSIDSQRLKNMQLSKLGEISALGSVEKPIVTPEQVSGHQLMWEEDNLKNYPYLLINPITDANGNEIPSPPVAYTKTAQVPQALAALLQITEDDINDLLGNQQNGEQINANVAQGTVELIQHRLDMQTFIYMSNMAKAMKRCGEIWLSMARDIYIEEGRMMKAVGSQGELERVQLVKSVLDDNGNIIYENDLSTARFDVIVDVGPSSTTKRQSTVRTLVNMASATDDPETKQVLGAMAMMNMEGEGISDAREYFRQKLIRMGVIKPTEQEQRDLEQELSNLKPTAEEQYFEAAADKERSESIERQSNAALKQAQTDKTRIDSLKELSDIDQKEVESALEILERFVPELVPSERLNQFYGGE